MSSNPSSQLELPKMGLRLSSSDPEGYHIKQEDPLYHAVCSALLLGKPLLLTGEPGIGKTELAYWLAWRMATEFEPSPPAHLEPMDAEKKTQGRRDHLLRFDTKSTSQARDLFYTYDVVGRFRDQQFEHRKKNAQEIGRYMTLNPLGKAIIRSMKERSGQQQETVLPPLPQGKDHDPLDHAQLAQLAESALEGRRPGTRPVVLIDEIDKAPRDFPNDILREIENLEFSIPEFRCPSEFRSSAACPPVVIMTSNSERDLPEAFLRRCVYHHLKFPEDPVRVLALLQCRLPVVHAASPVWAKHVASFFVELRKQVRMVKKPATAEFLDWLLMLYQSCGDKPDLWQLLRKPEGANASPPAGGASTAEKDRAAEMRSKTLNLLGKTFDDQRALDEALSRVCKDPAPASAPAAAPQQPALP